MTSISLKSVIAIMLNYNQSSITLQSIKSVLESDYNNLKVFVADNGSSETNYQSLQKDIEKFGNVVTLYRIEENIGYVGGMNFLLRHCEELNPAYILVMNNDTILDHQAVTHLVTCSSFHSDACIVTGKVLDFVDVSRMQTTGSIYRDKSLLSFSNIGLNEIDNGQYDQDAERDLIDDIFWLLPLNVLKSVGFYSELFYFNGESADYCLRAKEMGFKLIYCYKAKIRHLGSVSVGGRGNNPYLAYWQMRSTLLLRYLHLPVLPFIKFLLDRLLINIIYAYIKNGLKYLTGKQAHFAVTNSSLKGFIDFILQLKVLKK